MGILYLPTCCIFLLQTLGLSSLIVDFLTWPFFTKQFANWTVQVFDFTSVLGETSQWTASKSHNVSRCSLRFGCQKVPGKVHTYPKTQAANSKKNWDKLAKFLGSFGFQIPNWSQKLGWSWWSCPIPGRTGCHSVGATTESSTSDTGQPWPTMATSCHEVIHDLEGRKLLIASRRIIQTWLDRWHWARWWELLARPGPVGSGWLML